MANNSKFHPKDMACGEVIRAERADGESNGRQWHRLDVTIARRYQGKWDSEAREHEVWEQFMQASFWGDDIGELAGKLKIRVTDEDDKKVILAHGSEVCIKGWIGTRKSRSTGQVLSTAEISKPEFDWKYFYEANTESQDTPDEAFDAIDELNDAIGDIF